MMTGHRGSWRVKAAAAVIGTVLVGAGCSAQFWPGEPVTVVVPFPAGGGTDAFARPLAAQLSRQLGQPVNVDNQGGAGGNVGARAAAKAAPDGYTWFMGAVHHTIAPAIYPRLEYSLQNDFVPVALIASVPQVIVINPQRVQARDLSELLAYVRANPGKLTYGSAGHGTSHHLAGELFKLQTGTLITHVPYRGAGPALKDLLAGQLDMMFDGLGSSASHIRSGRLKALAIASPRRAPGFPDVPTTAEAGVPEYQVATWYGLWAPRKTPRKVVERMAAELQKAHASPAIQETWAGLGADPPTLTGEAFGAFVGQQVLHWAEVAKAAGIKLE